MTRKNLPWFFAGMIPLAYLTKSLMIPMIYLNIGVYTMLYRNLAVKEDACIYCRPTMKDLHAIVPEQQDQMDSSISIGELHRRRTEIMKSLYSRVGGDKSL